MLGVSSISGFRSFRCVKIIPASGGLIFNVTMTMKTLPWMMFLVACSSALAEPPVVLKEETLRSFSYAEAPQDKQTKSLRPPAATLSESDVVQMETFNVVESVARRDLEKAIGDHAAEEAKNAFSWTKGGLIKAKKVGATEVEFGLWPQLNSFPSGLRSKQDTTVRVEVLHLRW